MNPINGSAKEHKTMVESQKTSSTNNNNMHGSRGEVGVASAGLTMRQRWNSAINSGLSLKKFARQLVKSGDAVAQEWFQNKKGAKNQQRSDKNTQRIAAEANATSLSRKKSSKK
jgi:hypothetical protein